MKVAALEPEDFELLLAIGILAPVDATSLAAAMEQETTEVDASLERLLDARLIELIDDQAILTGEGHKNLSRRNFRRVRDIGRMLYLWRGSRGND